MASLTQKKFTVSDIYNLLVMGLSRSFTEGGVMKSGNLNVPVSAIEVHLRN